MDAPGDGPARRRQPGDRLRRPHPGAPARLGRHRGRGRRGRDPARRRQRTADSTFGCTPRREPVPPASRAERSTPPTSGPATSVSAPSRPPPSPRLRGQVFINPFAEPERPRTRTPSTGSRAGSSTAASFRRRHAAQAPHGGAESRCEPWRFEMPSTPEISPRARPELTRPPTARAARRSCSRCRPAHHDDPGQRFVELVKHSSLRPEAVEATALSGSPRPAGQSRIRARKPPSAGRPWGRSRSR